MGREELVVNAAMTSTTALGAVDIWTNIITSATFAVAFGAIAVFVAEYHASWQQVSAEVVASPPIQCKKVETQTKTHTHNSITNRSDVHTQTHVSYLCAVPIKFTAGNVTLRSTVHKDFPNDMTNTQDIRTIPVQFDPKAPHATVTADFMSSGTQVGVVLGLLLVALVLLGTATRYYLLRNNVALQAATGGNAILHSFL